MRDRLQIVLVFTVGLLGCTEEKVGQKEGTTTVQAALSETSAAQAAAQPASPPGGPPTGWEAPRPPGLALAGGASRAPDQPAAQHPGHTSNKRDPAKPIKEGPRDEASAAVSAQPAADYVAKQNKYLRDWQDLKPSLANLSPEEQEARRAALKKSVLGD